MPDNTAVKACWDHADIVRRLRYALRIAKQTIGLLATEGLHDPEYSDHNPAPEKVIGETAFLLLAASAVEAYVEIRQDIREVAMLLIPHARSAKTLLNICLHPALALDYGHAHICLSKIGYPDPEFDVMITQSITAHAKRGHERTPHRMIEQEWIKKIWNDSDKSIDRLVSHTPLNHAIDLLHGSREDKYAFTHAMMYVSNFNATPWKLPRIKKEVLDEAEAMIAGCLDDQDYDLAGELLLSWPLTGTSWSPVATFTFYVIMKIEDKAGFLPSQSIQKNRFEKLEGAAREKYFYANAYHTIYVMGLLCASILRFRKMPSMQIPKKEQTNQGIAFKIMSYLNHKNPAPFWKVVFYELSQDEQNALAPFLFQVAIIRSTRSKDYANLYKLLMLGQKNGLADTAIARQAAELLERLNTLSSILKSRNS